MTPWPLVVGCAVGAYLIGGIPFGLLLARARGVDIRQVGSGNIGAANVGRALGFRWGLAVFLLDMAKGLAAVVGAAVIFSRSADMAALPSNVRLLCWLGVGLAAVMGHNYCVYLGFRGGKGVATSLGVTLGFFPDLTVPALVALVSWGACVAVWRISSLASIVAGILFPIAVFVFALIARGAVFDRWPFVVFSLLLAALIIVRHRANIGRLIKGTEPRLGQPKKSRANGDAQPDEHSVAG
jgi:glycerol-3-phosphate acyltransferase PlsY